MAEDWIATQEEIRADLQEEGIELIFIRKLSDEYDPIDGEFRNSDLFAYTAFGIQKTHKNDTSENNGDGSIVNNNDLSFIISGNTKPEIGDTTTINGIDYKIVGVNATAPGLVALIYNITLRA